MHPKLTSEGKLPQQTLMAMTDKEVLDLTYKVRHAIRPGHEPMPGLEWDKLCNLETQLHLELVNRHFMGRETKTKRVIYKK